MDCVDAASRHDGIAGSHHAGRRQTRLAHVRPRPSANFRPRERVGKSRCMAARPPAAAGFASSAGPRWVDPHEEDSRFQKPRHDLSGVAVRAAKQRCGHGAPAAATHARTHSSSRPPRYPYRSTCPGQGYSASCDRIIYCRYVLATACLLVTPC
jgi:hypothetical protein